MKKILVMIAMMFAATAHADSVKLADGTQCSFDSDDAPWSVYAKGVADNRDGLDSRHDDYRTEVGIEYRFGGPERLDCSRLYNVALNIKDAELKEMREKLKILQAANSLNGVTWEE